MVIKNIILVDSLGSGVKFKNLNSLFFTDFIDKSDFLSKLDSLTKHKIESIIHQGACSDTMNTDGGYFLRNNFEYSKTLLQYSILKKIPFIYASSASVYGNGNSGFIENRESEYPLNLYAFSKYIFDEYARQFMGKVASPITGLRYFNVYGPQENHKGRMASVVFHFYNQIRNEKTIKIFKGSDKYYRDFIFVKDISNIVTFFMKKQTSGIFNCGTGEVRSFRDIAEIMSKLFGNVAVKTVPFPEALVGKYQTFTKANLNNLRKAGCKYVFTSLETGIKEYLTILNQSGGYYL